MSEASKMTVAEDKFKYILPYAAKHAVKIVKKNISKKQIIYNCMHCTSMHI